MDQHDTAYGCLFCRTGIEQHLADLIEYKCPDVCARAAMYVKQRTTHGVHRKEKQVFIPGYVFFRCGNDLHIPDQFPRDSSYRILKNESGDWRMFGRDYDFVQWLYSYDGLVGFSKAYEKDRRVYFLSGPIKDMEDQIVDVDRRGRSALIRTYFQNKCFKIWLGYDLVDLEDPTGNDQALPAGEDLEI